MKFQVNFSNNISLIYKLDTSVSSLSTWVSEINRVTINDLCPLNHKNSTGNKQLIEKRITRLYELMDILNSVLPNSIVKESLTDSNRQEALNRMHVHFPNAHNMYYGKDVPLSLIASEYNDIIHWLEGEYRSNGHEKFKIYLDFNKSGKTDSQEIKEEDFSKFDPCVGFGDLSLHYAHVGRHAREIFNTQDFACPKEQFVPQTKFTASIVMWFGGTPGHASTKEMSDLLLKSWNDFYYQRGGKEFFGRDIDDPKIAFGYLKIGKLSNIRIGETDVSFQTLDETEYIRRLLITNDIKSFYVE